MRVGNYESGMCVALSRDEHKLLKGASSFEVEVNPKAPAWLKIRPGGPHKLGQRVSKGQATMSAGKHPELPTFALQEFPVSTGLDGILVVTKSPDYGRQVNSPVGRVRRAKVNGKIEQAKLGLKEAVEAVNAHKAKSPRDVVLAIDDKGFLEITMRLGR